MADVNKTVSINYSASTEQLERALKKIPEITDAQANKAAKDFDSNFKKIETSAGKTAKSIQSKMKDVGKAFAVVGASVTAIGAGVIELSQKFADLTNELVDASTKTGIAVDTLAGLRLAAEGSGLGFAALEGGLIKFQGSILEASRGSKNLQDTFDRLGVSVKDSNGELRDADGVFNDAVKSLSQMENMTERNALAMQLFGRQSGPALIQSGALDNLQSMTALASEFGVQINDSAISSMGNFQRKMAEFGVVSDGVLQKLLGSIAGPGSVNAGIEGLTKMFIYLGSIASDVISTLGTGFENVFVLFEAMSLKFSGEFEKAEQLLNEQAIETKKSVDTLMSTFDRASAEVDKFNELSSASTAPAVMKQVAENTQDAVVQMDNLSESTSNLNEEMDAISEYIGEAYQTTIDLEDQVRDRVTSAFVKQRQEILQIGKDLRSHLYMLQFQRDEIQKNIDAGGDEAVLRGQLLAIENEIATVQAVRAQNQKAEIKELHQLRLDTLDEQHQKELSMHEALQSMISDKINSVSDIGGMVLETFGAISEALTAISNQQIDQIKSQTDKDIKKIDEMYKSGEISAEQSAMYKSGIEKKANEEMQALRIKAFKQSQASAIADVVFQGAIAIAKAFAQFGPIGGAAVAGLMSAKTIAQVATIKSQSPPKFDVGGMIGSSTDANAPDAVNANLLRGEAVLDRGTVNRLGGEDGVRRLQNGESTSQTIIIQPFKHFDRYLSAKNRRLPRTVGSGVY